MNGFELTAGNYGYGVNSDGNRAHCRSSEVRAAVLLRLVSPVSNTIRFGRSLPSWTLRFGLVR